tara:strand:+ start:123 stop:293 length:171 start_codon:yes stop_codon:yes gene_type:complete
MTRKDFIIVADALLKVKKHTTVSEYNDISFTVAKHLEDTCTNFNLGTFSKYLNTKK